METYQNTKRVLSCDNILAIFDCLIRKLLPFCFSITLLCALPHIGLVGCNILKSKTSDVLFVYLFLWIYWASAVLKYTLDMRLFLSIHCAIERIRKQKVWSLCKRLTVEQIFCKNNQRASSTRVLFLFWSINDQKKAVFQKIDLKRKFLLVNSYMVLPTSAGMQEPGILRLMLSLVSNTKWIQFMSPQTDLILELCWLVDELYRPLHWTGSHVSTCQPEVNGSTWPRKRDFQLLDSRQNIHCRCWSYWSSWLLWWTQ